MTTLCAPEAPAVPNRHSSLKKIMRKSGSIQLWEHTCKFFFYAWHNVFFLMQWNSVYGRSDSCLNTTLQILFDMNTALFMCQALVQAPWKISWLHPHSDSGKQAHSYLHLAAEETSTGRLGNLLMTHSQQVKELGSQDLCSPPLMLAFMKKKTEHSCSSPSRCFQNPPAPPGRGKSLPCVKRKVRRSEKVIKTLKFYNLLARPWITNLIGPGYQSHSWMYLLYSGVTWN